jgi:hypothetical protein
LNIDKDRLRAPEHASDSEERRLPDAIASMDPLLPLFLLIDNAV